MVLKVDTEDEFLKILKENVKVAVDFTAAWCGPCHMIGPKFEEMAKEFQSVKFIKVDVDENSDTAETQGIKAMPTFKFFKDGEEVDELVGASEAKLREKLEKLAG